jgi:cyclopropane fatty-acyl-phospholipid synthase-like methyltransferase
MNQSEYVLGHTDREQSRLIRHARALAPFTERFLRDTGIGSGMRVLDIGCGMGDVTMLAAGLVGPAGRVVSIDLDQASIETDQRRASTAGLDKRDVLSSGYLNLYGPGAIRWRGVWTRNWMLINLSQLSSVS